METISSRPYPVPEVKKNVKKELERLGILGFLERVNVSEWEAPSSVQPKPRTNQVHFLSNFINWNKK